MSSTTGFETKSYTEIFYIRTKVWRRSLDIGDPRFVRQRKLQSENPFPDIRNVLYVHVPFCATRCRYCLYHMNPYSGTEAEQYLQAVLQEIRMIAATPYAASTRFECVYIGGGTPSILTASQLSTLLSALVSSFQLAPDVEITLEANPQSLTDSKLRALTDAGCGRVSVGVQSFDDERLRALECTHTSSHAHDRIQAILSHGLIANVDLIFGFAGQSEHQLEADLDVVAQLPRPIQITYFPLRLGPFAPLYDDMARDGAGFELTHRDRLLQYDRVVEEHLIARGFAREEVPIFYRSIDSRDHRYHSLEGRILGLGAGGGTLLDNTESGNHFELEPYYAAINAGTDPVFADSDLTDEQTWQRFVLYRLLFMNRSLPDLGAIMARRFEEFFARSIGTVYETVLNDLQARGFAVVDGGRVTFTPRFERVLQGFRFGTPSII